MTVSKNVIKYILIFIIGAFAGYIYEVIYYYITDDMLINRGVLYGPWLPIYGVGAILISLFKSLKKNPLILFLFLVFLTGAVEYAGGFILLKFFDTRLWDYTGLLLNLHGFICLRSLLTFAIGGMILLYLIEPAIQKIIAKKNRTLNLAMSALVIIFVIDLILSILYRTPHS